MFETLFLRHIFNGLPVDNLVGATQRLDSAPFVAISCTRYHTLQSGDRGRAEIERM